MNIFLALVIPLLILGFVYILIIDNKGLPPWMERLKKGEGRADALAATQKEFRNHSIPGWRYPYVWATFQLSGDWRPIDW